MIEGVAIFVVGIIVGRVLPGRAKKAAFPVKATCECEHSLASHSPKTKQCTDYLDHLTGGAIYDSRGRRVGNSRIPCRCKQYIGPLPAEQYFAAQTLPPVGAS